MGRKIIDRIGEEGINNFGSKMIIINQYRENGKTWIDVLFPEYDWVGKNRQYSEFKKGIVKCPFEPKVYGHGYIGEGCYKMCENGKNTRCYDTWHHMLTRCFDENFKERYPTYNGVSCDDNWLDFQNFAKWYYENYYEIEGETMCLDKDILVKGNKIYSPETCIFVPNKINVLFTKSDKARGKYPVGVIPRGSRYDSGTMSTGYTGRYDTIEEAFNAYKIVKEQRIKQVADEYKNKIPSKLYDALYNYKFEIDD